MLARALLSFLIILPGVFGFVVPWWIIAGAATHGPGWPFAVVVEQPRLRCGDSAKAGVFRLQLVAPLGHRLNHHDVGRLGPVRAQQPPEQGAAHLPAADDQQARHADDDTEPGSESLPGWAQRLSTGLLIVFGDITEIRPRPACPPKP